MGADTASPLRFWVLDAYPREGREALRAAGGTPAGTLYERLLVRAVPGAHVDVSTPADADAALPSGVALCDYDGVVWTGSSLTVHHDDDPRVRRQMDLARALYRAGVPAFGSCWGIQLAVVAAGGACAAHPRGREFGVARKIAPSDAGRAHPFLAGRPPAFDAFTSHADHVVKLPPGATLLAGNGWSPVQAVAVTHGRGAFWAVQYHPEYDPHEVARLAVLRADELVALGRFRDGRAVASWVERLETLHRHPERRDLAFELGLDEDVLDEAQRTAELRNWIGHCVRPHAAKRR